ncbi:MAG: hypothetical protein K5694_02045 [Bacilli bacterium]|nr:hypothetical protein [Bacilli bacterium]
MKVLIKKGTAKGRVFAPPSKSYAHRLLIGMALSRGGEVLNLAYSDDIEATLSCLEALGFSFKKEETSVSFLSFRKIDGVPLLNCRASGSTLRFMIPIALAYYSKIEVTGIPRLLERGVKAYEKCFLDKGITIASLEDRLLIEGALKPGKYVLEGQESSQYISGMLFALPLLDGNSELEIIPPFNSRNYVDMTLASLEEHEVKIERSSPLYKINSEQKYRAKTSYVEGDYSNAAFLDAWNYLGGEVIVEGLNKESLQGDKAYIEAYKQLSNGEDKPIDISNCIDLGPVLFAFASLHHGGHFIGTSRLKIKESDRASVMKEELGKLNIPMEISEDSVKVGVLPLNHPEEAHFEGHNDHRIVMALSLFASVLDVNIAGAEAVAKSFPDYFEVLERLHLEVKKDG